MSDDLKCSNSNCQVVFNDYILKVASNMGIGFHCMKCGVFNVVDDKYLEYFKKFSINQEKEKKTTDYMKTGLVIADNLIKALS